MDFWSAIMSSSVRGLILNFRLLFHTPLATKHKLGDVLPCLVAKAMAEAQNVAVYFLYKILHPLGLQRDAAWVHQVHSDGIGLLGWMILKKKQSL